MTALETVLFADVERRFLLAERKRVCVTTRTHSVHQRFQLEAPDQDPDAIVPDGSPFVGASLNCMQLTCVGHSGHRRRHTTEPDLRAVG